MVLIAPLKVSHTRAELPRPCRVTVTVCGSPLGAQLRSVARNVSSGVLPSIAAHRRTPQLRAGVRVSIMGPTLRTLCEGNPKEAVGSCGFLDLVVWC